MKRFAALAISCLVLWGCSRTPEPTETDDASISNANTLCVDGQQVLCSIMPHDITKPTVGYSQFGPNQKVFDNFSWQMFVALNWPANDDGKPSSAKIGTDPTAKRVWQFYPTADSVMGADTGAVADCIAEARAGGRRVVRLYSKSQQMQQALKALGATEISGFVESTGQPLIDVDLNFALYDVVVNPIEATYIQMNGLNTVQGQNDFKGDVEFPRGFYEDPQQVEGGSVGAVEIKTAWRILLNESDFDRFFTMDSHVVIDPQFTVDGKPLCFDATLGLVGFHALQRTENPNPQDWMWSTFEHVDNAPLATNAESQESTTITIATCDPPAEAGGNYSFFNSNCEGCPTNVPPQLLPNQQNYLWERQPPYAALYAVQDKYGTQVTRCWKIYSETAALNALYQEALRGTVWANYQLISTQWKLQPDTPNPPIDAPTYLSNSTLETYIQISDKPKGSCLHCHMGATIADGRSANFSFVLSLAK